MTGRAKPPAVPRSKQTGQDVAKDMVENSVELLVCTTCRKSIAPEERTAIRPGSVMHERLSSAELPEGVVLRGVECLSNCKRGCSVILRGEGKWTYVYGNLDPDAHVETVIDGATKYLASEDGLVPWRERPEHFRKNCIARIPPLELPDV